MTDLETVKAMLERASIEYVVEPGREIDETTTISVFRGYSGFVSIMTFDAEGKLLNVEAFE